MSFSSFRYFQRGAWSFSSRTNGKSRQFSSSSFKAWYSNKLDTHPLLTKGVSSGIIAGTGDVICQYLVAKLETQTQKQQHNSNDNDNTTLFLWWWDGVRTARFVVLGAFLVAPIIHVWYGALATRIPGSTSVAVVKRVVVDQFVMAPLFIPTWLACLWTLEGDTPSMDRMVETAPAILVANWVLWIPMQVINFGMVPLKFQVLFSNVVALAWNCYLSYSTRTSNSNHTEEEKE
jgi:hypothetical protein